MNRSMLSSESTSWGTPRAFYDWLDRQFRFTLDVCATKDNAKHPRFFSPKDNGLSQSWEGETAFCNPPYGDAIAGWAEKCRDEALHNRAIVAMLVPSRVDTRWWAAFVMSEDKAAGRLLRSGYDPHSRVLWLRWDGLLTGVYHHDARLRFEGMSTDSAPFPSSVVIHASPGRSRPPSAAERDDAPLLSGWLR